MGEQGEGVALGFRETLGVLGNGEPPAHAANPVSVASRPTRSIRRAPVAPRAFSRSVASFTSAMRNCEALRLAFAQSLHCEAWPSELDRLRPNSASGFGSRQQKQYL